MGFLHPMWSLESEEQERTLDDFLDYNRKRKGSRGIKSDPLRSGP
jgi:hypothetical protein